MKIREFIRLLNKVSSPRQLDIEKIVNLTDDERSDMVNFIVRNRQPVIKDLIPEQFDMSWLASMGYLYTTTGKSGYTFVHTCEHRIK
jgi:hypothetical protein